MTIEFIPVNEPALGTESATSEVIHTFNVMQRKDDGTFISHSINQNPIMNCTKPLSELSLVEMKCHENSIDGDEFVAQLCLDSTKAFLTTPSHTGQLDMSKFDHTDVYTIKGPGLEFLLSPCAKTMSLQGLNDLYQCHRITNGESTQVFFNELNRKDYDWLQLDNICVSVFKPVKGGKLLHYTRRVALHWSSTNLVVHLLLLSVETECFTKEMSILIWLGQTSMGIFSLSILEVRL